MEVEIEKYRYELLDFDPNNIFSANNDDVAEGQEPVEGQAEVLEAAPESAEQEAAVEEVVAVTYSEDELEQAKAQMRKEGFAEGLKQAKSEYEEISRQQDLQNATIVQAMEGKLLEAVKYRKLEVEHMREMISALSFAVARKVISCEPGEELAAQLNAQIDKMLKDIDDDSLPKIQLNPEMADRLADKFKNVEIVKDEAILPSDFKIAWSSGLAERKMDELWSEIGHVLGVENLVKERQEEVLSQIQEEKLASEAAAVQEVPNDAEPSEEVVEAASEIEDNMINNEDANNEDNKIEEQDG